MDSSSLRAAPRCFEAISQRFGHRAQFLERAVRVELAIDGEGTEAAIVPAMTRSRPTIVGEGQIRSRRVQMLE